MRIEKLTLEGELSTLVQSCYLIESKNFFAYVPQTLGLPEATPEFIVLLDGHLNVTYNDKSYYIDESCVFTFIDKPILIRPSSQISFIKISFYPLCVFPLLKLTGISPDILLSSPIIHASDLFNNDIFRLESQLYESVNALEMGNYLSLFLNERLNANPINKINDSIINTVQSGIFTVDHLCDALYYEPRTLQRWFSSNMGISPKYFLRLQRFKKTIRELSKSQGTDFLDLAIKNGYYDQNHLIKEIKHFTGQTPNKISFGNYLPIQLKFD